MKNKKIAIIGKPGHISDSYNKSIEELNKEVGLNTGNLAFWYAMNEHIEGEKDYFGWGVDPKYLKENYDVLVFPAANQLYPGWDLSILADLFEKADLPLIICGLGAQAKNVGEKLSFKPGSKRFMKVISERAVAVGVRGDYTADVLNQNGIKNIEVIGCPSNFINYSPNLGVENAAKLGSLKDIQRIALNIDITESLSEKVSTMFNWSIGRDVEVINQAPFELLQLAHHSTKQCNPESINRIRNILAPGVSTNIFTKFVQQKFSTYFNTEEWMYKLKRFDLSIGTRMHGNMLAWQAGTPCILLPHDSRLTELVEIMQLPKFSLDKVHSKTTLESVVNRVEFDATKYDKSRQVLAKRYLKILEDTNVGVNPQLQAFVK